MADKDDHPNSDTPTNVHPFHRATPCPICNKPSTSEARPFCSRRCADLDLGKWLNGSYAIPVVETDAGTSDGEVPAPEAISANEWDEES